MVRDDRFVSSYFLTRESGQNLVKSRNLDMNGGKLPQRMVERLPAVCPAYKSIANVKNTRLAERHARPVSYSLQICYCKMAIIHQYNNNEIIS